MKFNQFATSVALCLAAFSGLAAKTIDNIPGIAAKPASYFFTGKPYDADLEAYNFKFRNYHPGIAQWTTTDPSGFPDGVNNRKYSPIATTQLDPTGLDTATASAAWTVNVTESYIYGDQLYSVTYPQMLTATVTANYTNSGGGITVNSVTSSQDSGLTGSVGIINWSMGINTTFTTTSSASNGQPVVTVNWTITDNWSATISIPYIGIDTPVGLNSSTILDNGTITIE